MTVDEQGHRAATDVNAAFDRARRTNPPSIERFERYAAVKQRNQRIAAGAVGLVVAAAGIILVVGALRPSRVEPAAPTPAGRILFGDWDPQTQRAHWYTMRSDGTDTLDLGIIATCAEWLPSGDGILITNDEAVDRGGPLRPAVVQPDGSGLVALDGVRDPDLQLGCGDVAPDGTRIVLEGFAVPGEAEKSGIYTIRASDGGDLVRLTSGLDSYPQYAPDGARVVFQRTRAGVVPAGAGALFVVDADGGAVRRITPWGAAFLDHAWSPDGQWIVFPRPYGELGLVHPDGTGLHTVPIQLPAGAEAAQPSWSPDGDRIVFSLQRGERDEIWTVHADGSGLRMINDALDHAAAPDWSVST